MKLARLTIAMIALILSARTSLGDTEVFVESSEETTHFQFETIAPPAINDIGATAKWNLLAGRVDANSGPIARLNDGHIPASSDDPAGNFFFAAGTADGLITVDLQQVVDVTQIVTYSWHTDSRAPQVYTIYGATGQEANFAFPESPSAAKESPCWTKLADVETRGRKHEGGQHAARLMNPDASLGKFRHLLFAVKATEPDNRFSHTFFSEIDVISDDGKALQRVSAPEARELKFATTDQAYRFTIDTTQAQELEEWTSAELQPVIVEWYPKIVAMLPSENFEAPTDVRFRYLRDSEMKGIPAYASGNTVSLNAEWFRGQLQGEARGAVVHEMVHIVQKYPGRGRRNRGINVPPGWIVEGIPDYIRWFLYEPETGGAKLSPERLKNAKHDASYRTSANFIDWVIRNHPNDDSLLQRLNAAARDGEYSSDTWKRLTGKTEQELAEEWRNR